MLEGNTNVSADAEKGDVSFCRLEGRTEEEDKLNQGLDSDTVFSRTFSNVSYCSSASSASSLRLLDSCIDFCPNYCNCIDDFCSSYCIDCHGGSVLGDELLGPPIPPSKMCNRILLYRSFHKEVRLGGWGLRGRRPRH